MTASTAAPSSTRQPQPPTHGPVPFLGTGLAGRLWTLALVLWSLAAVGVVAFVLLALQASWGALAAAGLVWLVAIVALVVWACSALAAAVGLGRLAQPVLGLGAASFALAGLWAAASLDVTGERATVLAAALVCLAGCAACAVAWWRKPPATASSP